ncbi:hypothetical protein FPZ24_01110 [Sphingomonas panacisoli]|uniref:Uncharacterized protein n=1 Tax=Sphingomonas panacisoli TaxID=1813879 RepID=A0A5B8LET1_9SPHN|nr:hypothetical protein [Sphingomonas panacisoli]QDZ06245.1 hypothetical protein FPZ24_01110 [Sphingomonas panacisoli]
MKLEAPPSRYRVVERGGRLVVLDSVAGGTPLKAKELLPAATDDVDAPSFRPPMESDDQRIGTAQEFLLQALASRQAGYTASQSPIAQPPGLLRNVAATICSDKRDGDGRLLWTTARWFDAKGPRTIALSAKAEPQLGFATLMLLAAAFFAVILIVAVGFVAFIMLFVVGSFLRQAKPASTAWIDRLAAS